jgi:uncharacterized low-complexity protein
MIKLSKTKTSFITVAAVLFAVFGFATLANSSTSPFAQNDMNNAAKFVKDGGKKCGEGKCGGDKAAEKKCGDDKAAEKKCGEGKCGDKAEKKAKKKCGEGKCG